MLFVKYVYIWKIEGLCSKTSIEIFLHSTNIYLAYGFEPITHQICHLPKPLDYGIYKYATDCINAYLIDMLKNHCDLV